jgi:hypothetical protein
LDANPPHNRLCAFASLLVLFVVFAAQHVLFRNHALDEVAPFYPTSYDQASYLTDAYLLFEGIRQDGPAKLLGALFSPEAAQGKLFIVQANAVFLFLGPSRLNAILPNLFYFLALQASVFYLTRKASGRFALAFLALGLMLMLAYPFYLDGRIFDFRMDFQAFCLYGIFVSALVASRAFLNGRWTIAASVIGFLLVLLRHVALGYLGGVYISMLVFLSLLYFISGDENKRKDAAKRIRRVVLSGLAILGSTLPFLWASRAAIYEYYVVGHFLGKEKDVRSPGWDMGMTAQYYLGSAREHFGPGALVALKVALVAALAFLICAFVRKRGREASPPPLRLEIFLLLIVSTAVPYLTFITDMNKNPVVAGVLTTPAVLFCVLALARGLEGISVADGRVGRVAAGIVLVMALSAMELGLKNQLAGYGAKMAPERRAVLEAATRMSLDVGEYSRENSISSPKLAFDSSRDYFREESFTAINYEAGQGFLPFRALLGNTIFGVPADEAAERIRSSDVAIFSPEATGGGYPFDASIDASRPKLFSMLEREFLRLKEYKIGGRTYYLFVKPGSGRSGTSRQPST